MRRFIFLVFCYLIFINAIVFQSSQLAHAFLDVQLAEALNEIEIARGKKQSGNPFQNLKDKIFIKSKKVHINKQFKQNFESIDQNELLSEIKECKEKYKQSDAHSLSLDLTVHYPVVESPERNNIYEELTWNVGTAIKFYCPKIKKLKLKLKNITFVPTEIQTLSHLFELTLSGSRIQELRDGIGSLNNLRSLEILDSPLRALPSSLWNLKQLKSLTINGPLKGCSISELPPAFSRNESLGTYSDGLPLLLETLEINSCGLSKLPDWIGEFRSLKTLILEGNLLTRLPKSFSRLQDLRTINLQRNNFKEFPEQFFLLRNLEQLYFGGLGIGDDTLSSNQKSLLSERDLLDLKEIFLETIAAQDTWQARTPGLPKLFTASLGKLSLQSELVAPRVLEPRYQMPQLPGAYPLEPQEQTFYQAQQTQQSQYSREAERRRHFHRNY